MARVTRARARLQRVADLLGMGVPDDSPAPPKMLDWGLKEKKVDPTSARSQRAARRSKKTEEDWQALGFQPKKIKEEERQLEQKAALNYVEPLDLQLVEDPGVITLFRYLRPGLVKIDMAKQWNEKGLN